MLKKVFSVYTGIVLLGLACWLSTYAVNLGYFGSLLFFSKLLLGVCILIYGFSTLIILEESITNREKVKKFFIASFMAVNFLASFIVIIWGVDVKKTETTLSSTKIPESAILSIKTTGDVGESKKSKPRAWESITPFEVKATNKDNFGRVGDFTLTSKEGVKLYKGISVRLSSSEGDVVTKHEKVKVNRKVVNLFGRVTSDETVTVEVLK